MSILISFLVGLFLGLIVMGLAAAVSREEQLDGKEDDDEIRLIKAENADSRDSSLQTSPMKTSNTN